MTLPAAHNSVFGMKSAVLRLGRRASRIIVAAIFLLGALTAVAQFAPEDQVRLRRNEPLLFKSAVFREGKAGETFKVVKYDAKAGRVFLLATGSDGKPFALHCSDQALEPMPKDYWALVHEGVRTMQQGDLARARALFIRAATADDVDKMAVNLALHCETLSKNTAALAAARATAVKAGAEAVRLVRNAQAADRPSLTVGDTSNQTRAEEMRSKAAAVKEQTAQAIVTAEDSLRESLVSAAAFADALIASGSPSIGLPASDAIAAFAAKVLEPERRPERAEINRGEINARINAASDALAKARRCMEDRQLRGVLAAVESGLRSEPGRGELKRLRLDAESRLSRVKTIVSLAGSLKAQRRFEDSLAEVVKAEALCADDEELRKFAAELRAAMPRP